MSYLNLLDSKVQESNGDDKVKLPGGWWVRDSAVEIGQTEKVNGYISFYKANMLSQFLTHDLRRLAVGKVSSSLLFQQKDSRYTRAMAQPVSNSGKKLIQIDVSSDTVCPWCFVGKRNMDKAIAESKDRFDFEIRWHPFSLEPSAPKEGVNKLQFYREKFGSQADRIHARMAEIFRGFGLEYSMAGLTGNTLDSHRLLYFAGQHGLDKQHNLAEELFLGYFTQAKYIGDREFLLECARKVGLERAADFLEDPNNGVKEVNEELQKYSANITGVPYYVVNGKYKLSGGQPTEVFQRAFEAAAK